MRVLSLTVSVVAGVVLAATACAAAQPRPVRPEHKWCYVEPPPFSIQHCHFDSIEECRVEIPGMGGFCNLNPWYVEPPPPAAKPAKRKRPAR
jgi:hypothetical protein